MTRAALHGALRAAVLLALAAGAVLAVALRWPGDTAWWVELARFMPWYWGLLAATVALALAFAHGRAWVWAALVNIAVFVGVTLQPQWRITREAPGEGATPLRVMTYNVKAERLPERPALLAGLAAEVRRHAPDVLVMQDAVGLPWRAGEAPPQMTQRVFGLPHAAVHGQYVIASRHPLRRCGPVQPQVRDLDQGFMRCMVALDDGRTLNIVTAHLLTPRRGLNAALRDGPLDSSATWQRNHALRLSQARRLAAAIDALPRPLIVAGDLNAPPSSPMLAALLAQGLRDTFAVAGRGFGFSYGQAVPPGLAFLRIDHILASPDLGVAAIDTGDGAASEHRPVVADLFLPATP